MQVNAFQRPFLRLIAAILAIGFALLSVGGAYAQGAVGASTGLPLPRFVSVPNSGTNVRVGPGTRYNVAWVFVRGGVPVEVVQEFDVWRKIRDVEGAEGWLHQSLLSGTRTAIVTPWASDGQVALRVSNNPASGVRAWLTPNLIVALRGCENAMCEVRFTHRDANGNASEYRGFVEQETLWGVYPQEEF